MSSRWSDEIQRDDSLDDENYHMREVYAQFGLAVYMAQVLEHGVVNLLSGTRVMVEATSQEDYDTRLLVEFRRTLGALVKRLGDLLDEDPQLMADLSLALERRNYLIHRYWRERVQLTTTVRGRNRMLEELGGIRDLLEAVDKRVDSITFRFSERNGVSRSVVEQLVTSERETLIALDGYLPDELPDLRDK